MLAARIQVGRQCCIFPCSPLRLVNHRCAHCVFLLTYSVRLLYHVSRLLVKSLTSRLSAGTPKNRIGQALYGLCRGCFVPVLLHYYRQDGPKRCFRAYHCWKDWYFLRFPACLCPFCADGCLIGSKQHSNCRLLDNNAPLESHVEPLKMQGWYDWMSKSSRLSSQSRLPLRHLDKPFHLRRKCCHLLVIPRRK